jgi:hypothetical protein
MSGNPSPYVLNIIELQNVITSASGTDPVTILSNQVANLQQMVNYDLKQINVNAISNYNTTPIQVYSPLNLCNVSLTTNGITVSGTGSASTIGSGSNGSLVIGSVSTSLLLQQNGISSFFIGADCNATFIGSVTATNFINSSDARKKRNIQPITEYETILSSIHGVRFEWLENGQKDVGLIAQDILPVLPEAVTDSEDGYKVAYMKIIPVLVEAVKALQLRVNSLERTQNIRIL